MKLLSPFIFLLLLSCKSKTQTTLTSVKNSDEKIKSFTAFDSSKKVIHVLVALCDNKYQGIVPVPQKIGNGQDVNNNLYWGCSMGVRSYFKNSANWQLIKKYAIDSVRMERIIFKHKRTNYYLVADAYNGKYIKQCTIDFLNSNCGKYKDTVKVNGTALGINGNAKLLAYIGHDGLMDFSLTENFNNTDGKTRDAIMLACISKRYFANHLNATKANPIVWSTGLMSPEAYTLHDALEAYIKNESPQIIKSKAASAYARYQHCSERAANNLLVTGY